VYRNEASAAVQVSVPSVSRGSGRLPAEFTPAERPQGVVAVALEMSRVFDRIVVADQRDIAIVLELVGVTVAVTARVECHKRTMSKESWRPFPTSTSSLSL